jgi:GxxExxY protein
MKVHTTLGPGFPEKIYHRAVIEELKKKQIQFESEKEIKVLYDGKIIGTFVLDLIIEDKIVLEIKATSETVNLFKAQLISYLKASPYQIGILVNFGTLQLQYFRFYRRK